MEAKVYGFQHEKTFFVYESSPVDTWGGAVTLGGYVSDIPDGDFPYDVEGFLCDVASMVFLIAKHTLWEGDLKQEILIIDVPNPSTNGMLPVIMLKQNNNGSCFYGSYVPLPWLEDNQIEYPIVKRESDK
jgi:hypothetical protein